MVDLYWIPLGAGGHFVRFNGRVYEAIVAAREGRPRCALYHAALVTDEHAIEVAPAWDRDEASRGVVGGGAVGSRLLGRWRLFRYEIRCWRGGTIPDVAEAAGRLRLTDDPAATARLLDAIGRAPTPVWGRDELHTGEMWNSNSVVAWSLTTAGLPADGLRPPRNGRAPGWEAGLIESRRWRPSGRSGDPRTRPTSSPVPAGSGS